MNASIYLHGLSFSIGLIVAIGAQNAFLLRQGLRRQYLFMLAATATLCDWAMFALGAAGTGTLVDRVPGLQSIAAWGGAIYIIIFGLFSLRSAYRGSSMDVNDAEGPNLTRKSALLTLLAVTLLNPHAWLDTVVIVGGIAGQYPWQERIFFTLGAWTASLIWFTILVYGARFLVPLFRKPVAWRVLDTGIGLLMFFLAGLLIAGEMGMV